MRRSSVDAALRDGIVIAGVSTRAFAESAWRAGYTCETVDAFGDLDQKSRVHNISFQRDLGRRYSARAAAVASRRLAGRAAAYVGNFENHPRAVRRLADSRLLLGNPPEVLARARDPFLLAKIAETAGGRAPLTIRPAEAWRADAGRSWLRKPTRGGGGSGVRFWRPGEPLEPHEIAQEYIDGVPASMVFLADGREAVVLGLSRQLTKNQFRVPSSEWAPRPSRPVPFADLGRPCRPRFRVAPPPPRARSAPTIDGAPPTPGHGELTRSGSEFRVSSSEWAARAARPVPFADRVTPPGRGQRRTIEVNAADASAACEFRYAGSLYPLNPPAIESRPDPALPPPLEEQAAAVAAAVTAAFGLRGVNGLDFVLRNGVLFVLELNPRYPASAELIERATGLSIFDAHAEACRGGLPIAGRPRPAAGSAQHGAVWGKAILYARRDVIAADTRSWLDDDAVRDIPFPGERIPRGRPVCTVFARGADADDCCARLVAMRPTIETNLLDA